MSKRKISDDDDEATISLQDVIDHDNEMAETVNAVLGGSDDKNCTYPKGYINRQALYACSTCSSTKSQPGGICLACSLECHKDHNLYELYTKRNFRCDCGNLKFPKMKCKLFPGKEKTNNKNKYNQNFEGLYCSCHRPYPDEEEDVNDEMVQCAICEDWFHGRHLGETEIPKDSDYSEMICFDCTKKCLFLHKYRGIMVAPTNVELVPNPEVSLKDLEEKYVDVTSKKEDVSSSSEVDKPCQVKHARPFVVKGATFWPNRWRSVLCNCKSCLKEYEELNVSFILEQSDTVRAYEDKGKNSCVAELSSGDLLKGMTQVQKVEMLQGYNEMKEELEDFLKKFAEEGKVVTASDITSFFHNLTSKRQKFDLPFSCH